MIDRRRQAGRAYDRTRDLGALLPLWPHELLTADAPAHARLLARLRAALRAERRDGLAGARTYDLERHAALLRAYRAETLAFRDRLNARNGGEPGVRPR